MENSEFEHQKRAYDNYVKIIIPELFWPDTTYKGLHSDLTDSLNLTKVSLGDYFFEQYVKDINENLNRIENEVNIYVENNNYNNTQKKHIFYHKPLLENRINELIKEFIKTNKNSNLKKPKYSFDSTLSTIQTKYLYTNYFSIYFDCNLNDIENLFSDNVSTQITINKNIQLIDIIYFFYELVEAKIITAKQWQNVFDKTNCLTFNNSPVTSSKIKDTVKRIKKSTRDNNTINLVESLISYINK